MHLKPLLPKIGPQNAKIQILEAKRAEISAIMAEYCNK